MFPRDVRKSRFSKQSFFSDHSMKFTIAGFFTLVICVLFFFGGSEATPQKYSHEKQYMILIDAGSSGSRIHVHGYVLTGKDHLPIVDPSLSLKQKPGLSSFASNPHDAGTSLEQLHAFALENVPKKSHRSTPIYVQATAGLRKIPKEQSEAILEEVRSVVSKWGFYFRRNHARIISGTQEGINGWLAINYLNKVFENEEVTQEQTVGVIEMGGASMQITFCPDGVQEWSEKRKKNLETLRVAGKDYHLYTHSYLGYGQEMAAEILSKSDLPNGNPCYPKGFTDDSDGDFTKCVELIKANLFKSNEKKNRIDETPDNIDGGCEKNLCSFEGIFQPNMDPEKFYAIENFYYTASFFGAEAYPFFHSKLVESGKDWCSKTKDMIATQYENVDIEEMEKYCFASAYDTTMLTYGLNFTEQDLETDVSLVRDVHGITIDWALGAVIGLIQGTDESLLESSSEGFSPVVYVLALVGLAGVGALLYLRRNKAKSSPKVKYSTLPRTLP